MNHEVLWAPWRLAYVGGTADSAVMPTSILPGGDPHCFLCQAAGQEPNPAALLLEGDRLAMTLLNRFPYSNGHLLICPARHVAGLDALTEEEWKGLALRLARWPILLTQTMRAQGFNIGLNLGAVAGAGVPGHLHWHIVPRWNGDVNFMATLAGARVIPQALEAAWDLLHAAWNTKDAGDPSGAKLTS